MSLYISSLNSGSNGNCYYIGNDTDAVLVDVGISCREIEKRMKLLQLNLDKVRAIFVSHEHGDHITGIPALSKKYQLPVYITKATHNNCRLPIEEQLIQPFQANTAVKIGALTVMPFPKFHDAMDPHSFTIAYGNIKVGVFTDIGAVCSNLINHFKDCHAAFLEANYDEEMLMKGNYPYHLKKRISNGHGHLSNAEALNLFVKHKSPALSHLLLSHLSKNNNSPEIVQALFDANAGNTTIVVASRYEASNVYCVTGQTVNVAKRATQFKLRKHQLQLSLFN